MQSVGIFPTELRLQGLTDTDFMFLTLFLKPSFIICCCGIDFVWLHCFISTSEIFCTTCSYQSSSVIITSGLVGISVERVHSHLLQELWQHSTH